MQNKILSQIAKERKAQDEKWGEQMIFDEIYKDILRFRALNERDTDCPFENSMGSTCKWWESNCKWCLLLFPEIIGTSTPCGNEPRCPCHVLGDDYVKSEMRRLFP